MTYNPEEMVDIVDENNLVVGQTTKQEAHERGLLHRTVIAELIDSSGDWILVKQASDRQDAGQYVSPVGGHVGAGESESSALIRETQEELGFTPNKYKKIGQVVYNRQVIGRQENHLFIVYEIYSDEKPILNHESVDYKKYSKSDISRLIKEKPSLFGQALHFVWNQFYNKNL